jgi:hypothetical protein
MAMQRRGIARPQQVTQLQQQQAAEMQALWAKRQNGQLLTNEQNLALNRAIALQTQAQAQQAQAQQAFMQQQVAPE